MWVLIKKIAQSWDTEDTVQHSYEIQYNNCNKVRFRHFDTQDLLRSKHSTFLLYIMRKSFWNENGWPVVFISRRLTDVHGVYVSCADLRGGGRESAPSLENSNLINSQCLISETDLGPDWKTKSSLASPSTLQKLSGSAHETGNGTNAPTHFEFPLVRPSVCQNY